MVMTTALKFSPKHQRLELDTLNGFSSFLDFVRDCFGVYRLKLQPLEVLGATQFVSYMGFSQGCSTKTPYLKESK